VKSTELPALRRAWDKVPSSLRRQVAWLMRSPRLRLTVLSVLRIRPKNQFMTLSKGLGAIDTVLAQLAADGPVGDYYEFGLFRGYTLWHTQQTATRIGLGSMRYFGFDSFQGLPEVEGGDRRMGIFFSGDYLCTRPEVERQLTEHNFDWSKAALVEGFFDQSLTPSLLSTYNMGPAALVLVDCDLYQSTVPVLSFLANLFQDGTIVLFDDWYCFGDSEEHGEPRAFQEFLAVHPEWHAEPLMDFPVYGKAFKMQSRGQAA
jgi:O-methyltransferase